MALILTGNSGSTTLDSSAGLTFSDSSNQQYAASPYVLKNRIINGDMRIDQRNAGASLTNGAGLTTYCVDRWNFYGTSGSKFSAQQNAGSVTLPAGFSKYLGFTSLSANTPSSSDFYYVVQPIEGFNFADIGFGTSNAKTITLSFQVYSSLTGTFSGCVGNGTRSYPFTYSVASANTWTQASITIVGDTTGTWTGATNGAAINVFFNLGSGATNLGTAGAWASANYVGSTSSVNILGTNGATWYITGVQLEIGTSATPFERRLYNQELANCQRYYEVLYNPANTINALSYTLTGSVANSWLIWYFKQTKRASPTFALGSGTAWVNATPTVSVGLDNINFTASNYFYANGSGGLAGLTASAEL
jgi:hypothetical protein